MAPPLTLPPDAQARQQMLTQLLRSADSRDVRKPTAPKLSGDKPTPQGG